MKLVLVVCKTRMKKGLCLGGIVQGTYRKIRLLTPEGENQPENTVFNVGDIWFCELSPKPNTEKLHTEDMLVSPNRLRHHVPNMRDFLLRHLKLEHCHHSELFDGLLRYTRNGSAYVSRWAGVPNYAHTFWLPKNALELRQERNRNYFYYKNPTDSDLFRLPYVGLVDPVNWLAPGTVLHLSLARWWRQPGVREKRCYLQLSAFFT